MSGSHIPTRIPAVVEETPPKRKIRILQVILVLSLIMMAYAVSGAVYTLVSNHSHSSFSVDLGQPVFTTVIPGGTDLTVANFTVRAFNTRSSLLSNLFVNITLDNHPNGTFTLNGIGSPNYQWIMDGPFSLNSNEAMLFQFSLNYHSTFGFYDIDASVVQLS